METGNPEIDALIIRKLEGTLSAEDEARLNDLLAENPSASDDIAHYRKLWQTSSKLQVHDGLPRDNRWAKLQDKIKQEEEHTTVFPFKVLLRYAAVVGGLVMLVVLYQLYPESYPVEIKTSYGETKAITLPDQSIVTLNAGTRLFYDSALWDDEREVTLSGEAYFNVEKSKIPFTVVSENATVTVLGTSFTVKARNNLTSVSCMTGSVAVHKKSESQQAAILEKGFGVTVDGTSVSAVYGIADDKALAWVSGDLHFNDMPLKDVFEELERHFDKRIVLKKTTGSQTFTGWFRKPELNNALQTICLSAGLSYTTSSDSTIIIE